MNPCVVKILRHNELAYEATCEICGWSFSSADLRVVSDKASEHFGFTPYVAQVYKDRLDNPN